MTNENAKDIAQFSTLDWLHPHPFMSEWEIDSSHIDHYQHTNNLAYLGRLEQLAWEHSASIGLCFADYQSLDRAMVITQHELNYHLPSHLGDTLICATWVVSCDKKLRLSRQFQYINPVNGKTIFTAKTHFVCVSLLSGMPKKMPEAFQKIYGHVALGS
ncbi:MAG: acyl-CoA thioester hydrolase [Alphaproteobacteria bacterium]|jgi:acyl-CoA thioester hydrolase